MSTRYMLGFLVCGLVLVMTAVPGPCSPFRLRSSSAMRGGRPPEAAAVGSLLLFLLDVMALPWPVAACEPATIIKTPPPPFQAGNLPRSGTACPGSGESQPFRSDSPWLADLNPVAD